MGRKAVVSKQIGSPETGRPNRAARHRTVTIGSQSHSHSIDGCGMPATTRPFNGLPRPLAHGRGTQSRCSRQLHGIWIGT